MTRSLGLGPRTLVMGVLNVTPDSFSDGGVHFDAQSAIEAGDAMLEAGAAMVDIGGESTRPGAPTATPGQRSSPAISAEEELRRILPVLTELRARHPGSFLSVDTYKAHVARVAAAAGADIVNDVSGGTWDAEMLATMAKLRCGVVLMHTRGRPHEWSTLPRMADAAAQVWRELADIARRALAAGVERERIVLDPGFGFGKNYDESLALLREFDRFADLEFPVLAGVSRKSFLGRLIANARGGEPPAAGERDTASVAAASLCALRGAHIVRAHQVRATVEAVAVVDAVVTGS